MLSQTSRSQCAHICHSPTHIQRSIVSVLRARALPPKISKTIGDRVSRIVRRVWRIFSRYSLASIFVLAVFVCTWVVLSPIDLLTYHFTLERLLPADCYTTIDSDLTTKPEIEKMNSAAATTLVTLLPALLTFAPFPMARMTHLIAYSTGAALVTASMTFGLSTPELPTLLRDRIFRVKDLCSEATVKFYGQSPPA